MTDYRVEFSITRRKDGEGDFTEIGFGSSGALDSIDAASFEVASMIQNWQWETQPGMPDPESLRVAERDRELPE
jgi:hypothetical protein